MSIIYIILFEFVQQTIQRALPNNDPEVQLGIIELLTSLFPNKETKIHTFSQEIAQTCLQHLENLAKTNALTEEQIMVQEDAKYLLDLANEAK